MPTLQSELFGVSRQALPQLDDTAQLAFGRAANAASLVRGVAGQDPVFGGIGSAASLVADAVSSAAPIGAIQSAVSVLADQVAAHVADLGEEAFQQVRMVVASVLDAVDAVASIHDLSGVADAAAAIGNALSAIGSFLSFVGSLIPGPVGAAIEAAGSVVMDVGDGLATLAASTDIQQGGDRTGQRTSDAIGRTSQTSRGDRSGPRAGNQAGRPGQRIGRQSGNQAGIDVGETDGLGIDTGQQMGGGYATDPPTRGWEVDGPSGGLGLDTGLAKKRARVRE